MIDPKISAAFAWSGHCVYGDGKSVAAVHRAVDSHDDMLAALKLALNHPMTHFSEVVEKPIRAAIAKAEGPHSTHKGLEGK